MGGVGDMWEVWGAVRPLPSMGARNAPEIVEFLSVIGLCKLHSGTDLGTLPTRILLYIS